MERKLINYLPPIVRNYDVYQGVMNGEQPEIDAAWKSVNEMLDNQFIMTASDLGLSRWEEILNITPKGSESLEERRFHILARINEDIPYTLPQLRTILETLCGKGNYTAEISEGTYILTVKVGLAAKNNFHAVEDLLQRMTPVNLVVNLLQMYNTHMQLAPFTHKQLNAYSHHQLRNEVL